MLTESTLKPECNGNPLHTSAAKSQIGRLSARVTGNLSVPMQSRKHVCHRVDCSISSVVGMALLLLDNASKGAADEYSNGLYVLVGPKCEISRLVFG